MSTVRMRGGESTSSNNGTTTSSSDNDNLILLEEGNLTNNNSGSSSSSLHINISGNATTSSSVNNNLKSPMESPISPGSITPSASANTPLPTIHHHHSSSSSSSTSSSALDTTVLDSAYMRKVLPAVSFWLTMSISVILFNKYLYMGPFKHPLSLTAIHMIGATIATQILVASGKLTLPKLGWDFYIKHIIPLGLMFAGSLGSSNLAAMRLSVSFIQMIKAVTPMMTLAVSVMYGTEKPYRSLILITTLMTFGVGIASYGEIEFDLLGLLLQLIALTVESIRLVAIQRVVQAHLPRSNPLVALAMFAPVCAFFLLPIALVLEPGAFYKVFDPSTGFVVFLNTLTAFSLNIAVVILVSHESGPLTLTLAGIIKDIALIISSIWLFGNPITYVQVVGYTLALYGLNMYHRFKSGHGRDPITGEVPFAKLAKEAATDKVMMVMASGLVVLLFVAQ